MTLILDLEQKLGEKFGKTPCRDEKGGFYYQINSVRKTGGCCLEVSVTVYLKYCDSALFNMMCQLGIYTDWQVTLADAESQSESEVIYIASTVIEPICICCPTTNMNEMTTPVVTVNPVQIN